MQIRQLMYQGFEKILDCNSENSCKKLKPECKRFSIKFMKTGIMCWYHEEIMSETR